MKKTTKLTALLLALLMLGTAFSACKKDEGSQNTPDGKQGEVKDGTGEGESVENPAILTGVYKGTALQLEENERIVTSIKPCIDKEAGEITFITTWGESKEEPDENGEIQYTYISHYYVVRVDMDMNILDKTELDLGEARYLNKGALTGDYLYYNTETYDDTGAPAQVFLNRMSLETGEIKTSTPLNDLFGAQEERPWFSVDHLVTDADGNVYICQSREVVVLNSEFIKQYSMQLNDWVNSMSSSPDGRVFVTQYTDNGQGLFEIDKTTRQLKTEPVYTSTDSIEGIMFGEGYDFYMSGEKGLSGMNADGETVLLMDYLNSDVNGDNLSILAVIDEDTILVNEDILTADGVYDSVASLYKKSADIDLSKIKVYELAAPNGIDYDLKPAIVSYNKANRDRRINVTDYSQYQTREDYTAGVTKLCMDMANGIYKPDLIMLTSYGGSDKVRDYIIENNLFMDYNTVLADRPEVLDDIFGGVKRALSTSDGRMWGMTNQFEVSTFLTNDPVLKEKDSWTLGEMLDYNAALPEGTMLFDDMTRDLFFMPEAGFFYNSFVNMEEYKCDFENETFYKFLEYIASLPTAEEISQQQSQSSGGRDENQFAKYYEGKVALYSANFYDVTGWLRSQIAFNTKEFSAIGYPSDTGCSGFARAGTSFVITTWCDDIEGAWDFIESAVLIDPAKNSRMLRRMMGIPAFRSVYDYQCGQYIRNDYRFSFYYSGGSSWGPASEAELAGEEYKMDRPGIRTVFTQEDADVFADFLDNRVGGMLTSSIPEEVMGIIGEEVSSFSAGVNTAESCAGKIQSRVAIWLSEHEQ